MVRYGEPPIWSDKAGIGKRPKDQTSLPLGWKWVTDTWILEKHPLFTDNDGW
jgi:hypothetical protein